MNLSTGSNPISLNLEGNSNGSVIANLPYKSVTGFAQFASNSSVTGYLFVVRDATSGDSLTQFIFNSNGYGMVDPNSGALLVFKKVTLAVYGSETDANFPLNAMVIDDY